MANLKGGSYEKQLKDAFHRLEAFGKGRHGKDDHLTHSDGLASKREMYLNDYKEFAEQNRFTDKLNLTMNDENISTFLNQRLEGLKHSTQENYVRGLNSMLKGLQQDANIKIPCQRSVFDNKAEAIRATALPDTRTGLSISNPQQKIEQLQSIRFESSVLAEVQQTLGLRISEAFEVVKNLDAHYNEANGTIENLVGKGNHIYEAETKMISSELVEKIRACENVPHPNTYRNDLKETGIEKSHLWRFTYAKSEFEKKINEEGVEYHQALGEISQELNHTRGSMSFFYLSKA